MTRVTVLAFFDRISVYHTLKPFLYCRKKIDTNTLLTITDSPEYCLSKDRNRILIMVRMFLKPDRVDHALMRSLRDKYERIAFFNGHPGGGLHHGDLLPYVDLYYNKSLWKDRSAYTQKHYGDELFTDYYHREFGIVDENDITAEPVMDKRHLTKLRLGWNVGVGDFPRSKYGQRAGVALARLLGVHWSKGFSKRNNPPPRHNSGAFQVHARLGFQKRNSLAAQRRLLLDKIADHPAFLTGPKIAPRLYNREVQHSKIVLSPFGLGELCFRDFEAIQSDALLVKPDMSHIQTWPDVFVPGETYVPVQWDGSDVVEKCEYYLRNETERKRIVQNAYQAYREQTDQLCDRFRATMAEITDL